MIRLPKIVTIRVAPAGDRAGWLTVRCLGGRAKWTEESRMLSLKADVLDEETRDKCLDFFASNGGPAASVDNLSAPGGPPSVS